MRKFLPVVFCGLAAFSYSQLTLAGGDYKNKDGSAGAGTSLSSETRDAQGREHLPGGKTGPAKKEQSKQRDSSAGAGGTSAPSASTSTDAAVNSDSTSGARTGDREVSGSTRTEVK